MGEAGSLREGGIMLAGKRREGDREREREREV